MISNENDVNFIVGIEVTIPGIRVVALGLRALASVTPVDPVSGLRRQDILTA